MSNKIQDFKNMCIKDKESFKKNWKVFVDEGKNCIKEFKNKETRHKQIPNAFTASRLFAPFFIIPAALSGNLILTGLFVGGFAFTDACDGYFARKYNAQSEFGRELDPITDKIFAGGLLLPLIILNPIMLTNLLLEAVIATINMHSRLNDNKPRTTIIGKIKTGSLSLTMLLSYINMLVAINPVIIGGLIATTGILQTATAVKYYKNFRRDETLKELRNLSDEERIDDINDSDKTLGKTKELVISKGLPREKTEELTTFQKIQKLNDLKQELIAIPTTKEDTKLYEKK